jgi:hypothetical protein
MLIGGGVKDAPPEREPDVRPHAPAGLDAEIARLTRLRNALAARAGLVGTTDP